MKKSLKKIKTDKSAEAILNTDLSDYIHSENFNKIHFELHSKNQTVTIKVPDLLIKALKKKAKIQGISYQKLIRQTLEKTL